MEDIKSAAVNLFGDYFIVTGKSPGIQVLRSERNRVVASSRSYENRA